MKNQPIITLRDGTIKVSVWENTHDKNIFYSTNLVKGYKQGDEWKETTSLNTDDLLKSARLLERTHDEIIQLKQSKDT